MMIGNDEQVLAYNLEKFKQFLAGHTLQQLAGKSGVLVLGEMGVGKSTTISIQLGAIWERRLSDENRPFYALVSSETYTPKTSSGVTSTTLNIHAYPDPKSNLLYIDTAGLNENRGKEEELWTGNNLDLLFSVVNEFKSIVVVIDYGKTFSGRDEGIQNLVKILSRVTMNNESFYDSMVFVITNGYELGNKISINGITAKANGMIAEFKNREIELIRTLNNRYPAAEHLVNMNILPVPDLFVRPHFNPEAVPEEDLKNLETLQNAQKLLKAITANRGQGIVLSYPDNQEACQRIRQELLEKIQHTPAMRRETLQRIRGNQIIDTRLLFLNVLSSLASKFQPKLSENRALLRNIVNYCQKERALLDSINRNWEVVKRNLTNQKGREIRTRQDSINQQNSEIERLKSSTNLTVLEEHHILKERKGGFFAALNYLMGQSKANANYEYTGQTFVSYHVSSTSDFEYIEHLSDPNKGKLQLEFISHNGFDLNLKVIINVYEKDLPATKERIRLIKQEKEISENQLDRLETLKTEIESVENQQQLYDVVTRDNSDLQTQLGGQLNSFNSELENTHATEWHAVKGLESLFILFRDLDLLHPELSMANCDTINDFLASCATINTALEDPYVKILLQNRQNTVLYDYKPFNPEIVEPVIRHTILSSIVNNLQVPFNIISSQNAHFFQEHQFELGCCIALLGILLWYRSSHTNNDSLPVLLIISGVFTVLAYIRQTTERIAADMRKTLNETKQELQAAIEEIKEDITHEAQKANITARELGMFAIQRLTDKIEVKADISPKAFVSGITF